eukprot:31083-Pelagococcus_subviridis.AAC.22
MRSPAALEKSITGSSPAAASFKSSTTSRMSSSSSSDASSSSSPLNSFGGAGAPGAVFVGCIACVHSALNAMLKKIALPGSRATRNPLAAFASSHLFRTSRACAAAFATDASDARSVAPSSLSRAIASAFARLNGAAAAFAALTSRHVGFLFNSARNFIRAFFTSSANRVAPPPPPRSRATRFGSNVITLAAPKLTETT